MRARRRADSSPRMGVASVGPACAWMEAPSRRADQPSTHALSILSGLEVALDPADARGLLSMQYMAQGTLIP